MSTVKNNYKIDLPDGRVATRGTNRDYHAILVAKIPADEFRQECYDYAEKCTKCNNPKYAAEYEELAEAIKEDAVDYYLVFSWHGTRDLAEKAAKSNGMGSFRRSLERQYSRVEPVIIEF